MRTVSGNYEKILEVNGFAERGTIHIRTVEGNEFWCKLNDQQRYEQIPPKME